MNLEWIFNMRNQIVILAAGKGTRMGGSLPKVLVLLKNKPLILYLLDQVAKINQLIKPVVVIGYKGEMVKTVLGDDYFYAWQTQQLGTAHALMSANRFVKGENILVLYGDMPFIKAESLKKLMKLHHEKKSKISMLTATVNNFSGKFKTLESFGRVVRDTNKKISKIIEYKDASAGQKKITEINPGIYMFKTSWLWSNMNKIKNKNAQGEYYLTDIVEVAMQGGVSIESVTVEANEVLGVNSREDLSMAEELVKT